MASSTVSPVVSIERSELIPKSLSKKQRFQCTAAINF
jgi:hypothetical protein